MIEISKELLSEVLEEEVLSIRPYIDNDPFYKNVIMWECRKYTYDTINIYELAHKCKEWALVKHNGFLLINSSITAPSRKGWAKVETWDGEFNPVLKYFTADTEYEAIFKACEWIRKEISK